MKRNNSSIVVVEDNDRTRFLVAAILASMGYKVLEARNGKEALKLLSQDEVAGQINAIFLDVVMPELSGIEVLSWIRKRTDFSDIPVLMLTTKDMAEDLIDGYNLGADYYIPKPFSREQIEYGLNLVLNAEKQETA